jgi:arylsulfatase A-like enzyme
MFDCHSQSSYPMFATPFTPTFLVSTAFFAIAWNAVVTSSSTAKADDAPPNVLFIMADDLGYGDLGCYGQEEIQTTNLDRLAAEGMRFTNYYAGSTVCAPSRCVLMTGLHTGHCFIRGNSRQNLRPGDTTVAEMLKQVGYATGQFGKWGLGGENTAGMPIMQGFDGFYGYLDQIHAHNYYPTFLIDGRRRAMLNNVVPDEGEYGEGMATEKNEYSHDLIIAEAVQFLLDHQAEPFFLYLPVTIPHANNEAGDLGMEVPSLGHYADRDWPEPEKAKAAMISRLDSDIGQILDLLDALELAERTVVFFTSDNGPHREGGIDPEFVNSNGNLRGIKRDLYEGGVRVPMIVRWPGHIEPGTTSDHVAYHGDVFATLTELTGARTIPGLDSVSFVPALLKAGQQPEHDFLYWEFLEGEPKQAVRQGPWKAIRFYGEQARVELYDLSNDVSEANDLAASMPEQAAALVDLMESAHLPSANWPSAIDEVVE